MAYGPDPPGGGSGGNNPPGGGNTPPGGGNNPLGGGNDPTRGVNDQVNKAQEKGKEAYDDGVTKSLKDLTDKDQDDRDRARNAKSDVAKGLRDLGLDSAADAVDKWGKEVLGLPTPDTLPNVVYRVFFGSESLNPFDKDNLERAAGDLAKEAGKVAGGLAKSGLDSLGGLGEDFGAAAGSVESFFEAPKEETETPLWKVEQFTLEEALNDCFRCEVLLSRPETRNVAKEAEYASQRTSHGIVGQVRDVVDGAENAIDRAKGAVDRADSALDRVRKDKSEAGDMLGDAVKDLFGGGGAPDHTPYINIPLDPGAFLNQGCSVSVSRENSDKQPYIKRWITGYVSEFEDLGSRVEAGGAASSTRRVRVVVRPALWKLSLRKDCRIFQNANALQVVREVLRAASLYGLVPRAERIPGLSDALGAAEDGLADLASRVSWGGVGEFMADTISGKHIRTIPPKGIADADWTPKREYCVQYNETDLDFVCRILEEEGITWFVECGKRKEKLVLADDPRRLPAVPTIDGRPAPFRREDLTPKSASTDAVRKAGPVECVWHLSDRRTISSTRVTLRDFNFSDSPLRHTELAADGQQKSPQARPNPERLEVYAYPARVMFQYEDKGPHYHTYKVDEAKGDRDLARLRLEALIGGREKGAAHANLTSLRPGAVLKLVGHRSSHETDHETVARLLVLRARHVGADGKDASVAHRNDGVSDTAPAVDFVTAFEFMRIDRDDAARTPYRPPRRTPRPVIHGAQTATVVDDSLHVVSPPEVDDQIYRDHIRLGRVKVRFHWDRRGEGNPLAKGGRSCWLRVAHAWAGDNWGAVWVPRVGMEVLVTFLDGDPDRPLITGCLYNGVSASPVDYGDTKQAARSTIRTRSNPGRDPKYNELWFDDKFDAEGPDDSRKREELGLRAERFLVKEVRVDHRTRVGNDQKIAVMGHQGELIDGAQRLWVGPAPAGASRGKDAPNTDAKGGASGGDPKTDPKTDPKATSGDGWAVDDDNDGAARPAGGKADKHIGNRTKVVEGDEHSRVVRDRDERVHGEEEVTVHGPRSRTVHGREWLTSGEAGTRTDDVRLRLTMHGGRKTQVTAREGSPGDDRLEVAGSKTDTITGALEVIAASIASGPKGSTGLSQSKSPGDKKVAENEREHMTLASKKDATIDGRGDVKLLSPAQARLRGDKAAEARCNDNRMTLKEGAADASLTLHARADGAVELRCGKAKVTVAADGLKLAVEGPEGAVALEGGVVTLRGKDVAITMEKTINFHGAVVKFGA